MKNINNWLKQYITPADDPYAVQLTLSMNKNGVCIDMPELTPLYFRFNAKNLHSLYESYLLRTLERFEISIDKDVDKDGGYYRHSDFLALEKNAIKFHELPDGTTAIIIFERTKWCPYCGHVLSDGHFSNLYGYKRYCFNCDYKEY